MEYESSEPAPRDISNENAKFRNLGSFGFNFAMD